MIEIYYLIPFFVGVLLSGGLFGRLLSFDGLPDAPLFDGIAEIIKTISIMYEIRSDGRPFKINCA